jgi:hypothetical protein
MFSCISTEDILCDKDSDISYKAYSIVEFYGISCDVRCFSVMKLNDQVEYLLITLDITALHKNYCTNFVYFWFYSPPIFRSMY